MIKIDQLAENRIGIYLLVGSRGAIDNVVLSTLFVSARVVFQAAFL
jgi:hypothetical protein